MEFQEKTVKAPIRISITTFNVWGNNYWPARSLSLEKTLYSLRSDIYLFQELTPDIVSFLDKTLSKHQRVHESDVGWNSEGNIYWNSDYLQLVDHGKGNLEMDDYPHRGLFWVRLALKMEPSLTIFVSTAHFPWSGCETELATGINQRIPATIKVCEYIRKLVPPQEPVIFGGDLNDDFHPLRVLNDEMGMIDVFEYLDLVPPITHPVRPSDPREEIRPSRTLDWIVCSLPSQCNVVGAYAKTIRGGSYPPVSDHLPIKAIFEFSLK